MTKILSIFSGEISWADAPCSPCCLKLGMVQQNSNTLPLRANLKFQDASLPLCFMLCRLRCLSGFPVSCGDELILSTSLLPANRAFTMKCWLAQFHFACVTLASQSLWNQRPCSFCRTGFCVYLQWAVVGPVRRSDLGSQGGGQETKIFSFFHGGIQGRIWREAAFPRQLSRSPSNDFEAALDVGGSKRSTCGALGCSFVTLPLLGDEWKMGFNCLNSTGYFWNCLLTFTLVLFLHCQHSNPQILTWDETPCVGVVGSSGHRWSWRW